MNYLYKGKESNNNYRTILTLILAIMNNKSNKSTVSVS